jgi:uncharacterized protein (TIGR02996 family)
MTDGPALLRAVTTNPAENAPRLIYADWLDEDGQGDRAEFIRGQVRLSELHPWDDGFAALEARCRQLERAHPEWLDGLDAFVSRTERFCGRRDEPFERGFPARVKQTPAQFAKTRRAFARNPITNVRFEMQVWSGSRSAWVKRSGTAWLKHPTLPQLTGIEFAFLDGQARVKVVLDCLDRARPLDHFGLVGCGPQALDVRAVFAAPVVAGVRSLSIMGTGLTRETEAALVSADWPNLQRLTRVWIEDAEWLRAGWIGQLHELTVYDTEPNLSQAQRGLLAEVLPDTEIHTLRLGRWELDGAGDRALGEAVARSRVRSLALATTHLGSEAARALFTPEVLTRLRALYLSWAPLDARAIGRLAGSGLRVCALDHTTCDALAGLARKPGLPDLAELRLGLVWTGARDPVGARLAAALDAGTLPRLVNLMLYETTPGHGSKVRHGDEIAKVIAKAPAASGLRSLHLGESVTRTGAVALARSRHLSAIQVLNVRVWPRNADAERLLADRFGSRLQLDTAGIEF